MPLPEGFTRDELWLLIDGPYNGYVVTRHLGSIIVIEQVVDGVVCDTLYEKDRPGSGVARFRRSECRSN